jgi:CubicO group peptidase (beta-lactamase class C family)
MKAIHLALLSALLLAQPMTQAATKQQQVDALFAKWNKPGSPGAAVEVVKDGKVVYRHAFGMADIEQRRPITPMTDFHVASLSKQFTAFAVLLLAQDGKLSLDDDVRKYLPELPDFGQVIKIRHLMHHTSGLRDEWSLLAMAGWRMDDVITDDDVMRLVQRQRALNFTPGSDFSYCNTSFTLLSQVVQRVSGKSLAVFAKERIFAPLGMKHSFFHEQYSTLVPGRAQSYQPAAGGGYEGFALSYSTVGPTSLFTTADDLVLWANNFDTAHVGGKKLLAEMQQPAVLNDGKATGYGDGVWVGKYRGVRKIDHNGVDAGFRTYLARFPDQHLAVVIVGNGADVVATRLGQRIADIWLAGQLDPLPAPVPDYEDSAEAPLDPAQLDALAGTYALGPDSAITFAKENGHLVGWLNGDDKTPFFPASGHEFFMKSANASFSFDPPGADGVVTGGTWHHNVHAARATRIARAKLADSELKAYEGEFYSDELHVLYTVMAKDGRVTLNYSRGPVTLDPIGPDSFAGPWPFGVVRFQCTADAGCTGFTVNEERVRNLQFTKVAVVGAGASMQGATGVFLAPKTTAADKVAAAN